MASDLDIARREADRAIRAAERCQKAIEAYGRDFLSAREDLRDALGMVAKSAASTALKRGIGSSGRVLDVDRLTQLQLQSLENPTLGPDPIDVTVKHALAGVLARIEEQVDV
jgi:hypothetical protein